MNKIISYLVVAVLCFGLGIWVVKRRSPEVRVVEKEKVVYKYIKGDSILFHPDGSIAVNGNASVDSKEESKEKEDVKIDPKKLFTGTFLVDTERLNKVVGFDSNLTIHVLKDFGLVAGYQYYNPNKAHIMKAGLSVDFDI